MGELASHGVCGGSSAAGARRSGTAVLQVTIEAQILRKSLQFASQLRILVSFLSVIIITQKLANFLRQNYFFITALP